MIYNYLIALLWKIGASWFSDNLVWKYKMEETTNITLFGHEVTISLDSFSSLDSLCFPSSIRQIKLPSWIASFQPEEPVLNACIYYLIAVQKGLPLLASVRFHSKCLQSISEYYIRQRMNFQLYEYSYLSAKILSVPLERAMHVLYYLIYSRLASKPFILNTIAQAERKNHRLLNKKNTVKSEKQYSSHTKSHDSRHMTIFYDSNQIETEVLRRELKKILSPGVEIKKMTRKLQNKRYFNLKKVYPEDQDIKYDSSTPENEGQLKFLTTSRAHNIPVKVSKNDHSSVMQKLKVSGSAKDRQTCKKIQMRRQKFNEWFDGIERYEKIMNDKGFKENRTNEWGTAKNILEKDLRGVMALSAKGQKHPYEYYKEISDSIKNKNEHLDSIRNECFYHTAKQSSSILKESLQSNERYNSFSKNTVKTEASKAEGRQDNYAKMLTNRESSRAQNTQQCFYSLGDKEQKPSKSSSEAKLESRLQDHISNIITRKNQSLGPEQQNLLGFNKKLKNKFKLQKYKHQYRQFLKTQLFEKVKEAV